MIEMTQPLRLDKPNTMSLSTSNRPFIYRSRIYEQSDAACQCQIGNTHHVCTR